MAALLAPGVAGAATKEDLLRDAAALQRRGDDAHAVIALEQAFATSGDAMIKYDIGRAYERLKRPAEAFVAFGVFLDKATAAPDLYRQDATKRRLELRRHLIEIEIHCAVPGAHVMLDNRDLGQTPLDGPAVATTGAHQLHVEKSGYLDFDATVAEGDHTVNVPLVARRPAVAEISPPPMAPPPQTTARPPSAVETSAADVTLREPVGAVAANPTSAIEVMAGGVFWTAKEAVSSVTPGLTISGGHTVANIGSARLRLGGKLSVTEISERSTTTFWSLLIGSALRRDLGQRLTVYGGVDVGLLLLAGLQPDSQLLYPDTVSEVKSPGLLALEIRPSVGVEYALSPRWALVLGPQLVWNPRPTTFFAYQTLLRVDVSAGASVRF
ncbi:MAG TPA: PEGA domain-containing protein [Polyangia bacterium]|nr:PEGA domain-containing protein [Polyangia bacterium]